MGDRTIKLAVVGVGNCASSLIQGIEYYKDAADDAFIPGLMHANFGGYHVRDIEVVAAFDVHSGKVGRDVAEAIYAEPMPRRWSPAGSWNGCRTWRLTGGPSCPADSATG